MMKIGAQMYTVKDHTKTLDDFADTLAKLADIGFKCVQVSGTCPYEADWLAEQLKKNGLACAVTHTSFDAMVADVDKVIANHKTFGCKYIGIGGYGGTQEGYEKFIERAPAVVKKIKDAGLRFTYHNHSQEFIRKDGITYMEKMMSLFSPDEFSFTFDTYWAQAAGADPIQWLSKLAGRVQCIHLKDMIVVLDAENKKVNRYAPVGSGNMNFEGILAAADAAGTEYGLIEQDDCYGEDQFECLKKSLAYLRAQGYKD